jgi:hypothetical protein
VTRRPAKLTPADRAIIAAMALTIALGVAANLLRKG